MDSQVKERIVGAVVLVALGVWLIPWVLDGSGKVEPGAGSDVGIELPSADESAAVRTEVVELTPSRQTQEAAAQAAAVTPVPASRADAGTATPTPPPVRPDPAVAAAEAADTRADTVPESASAAASTAAPAGRAATPVASAATGGWSVQLGAFSDSANARQLAGRVKEFGYAAEVSDYQSGGQTLHRVRVAGFATRAQAEAAQSALAAHDFVAQVFAPE